MRDLLTSPDSVKIKHNRRVQSIRLRVLLSILFLSIVGALAFFSGDKHVVINKVTVTGTHIINASDVESLALDKMNSRYFYLFSRSNSLIYPKLAIYNSLRETYPRIEKLSVYKDNWHTLHIDIVERQASYLYCGSSIPAISLDVGENCYFINSDGYVFDKAPYFSGNIYFKYYTKIPDENANILGQYLMPVDRFHSISRFIDNISGLGFKPIYVVIDGVNPNLIYLDNTGGTIDHVIMFNEDNDLDVIFSNFSASMKIKEFADEINAKYANLEYIDLRFKNKVLYKAK